MATLALRISGNRPLGSLLSTTCQRLQVS